MYKISAVVFSVILASAAVIAQESPLQQVEGAADLERVKRAKFRETYVSAFYRTCFNVSVE